MKQRTAEETGGRRGLARWGIPSRGPECTFPPYGEPLERGIPNVIKTEVTHPDACPQAATSRHRMSNDQAGGVRW